jgi:hypothetical protein
MKKKHMMIIAMNTEIFTKPLAELSVILLWYFWIIDSFVVDLATQKISREMMRPKSGIARRSPVPPLFLKGTTRFP